MNSFRNRKPFFILIPIAIFFAVGFVVMLLWNALLPLLFGIKYISYMQALGLFLLSRLLFGRFGFGNRRPPFVKHRFREKMMNMSDEERNQFKEEWRRRCNR